MNKFLGAFAALAVGTLAAQSAQAQYYWGHRPPPPRYDYATRPVMHPRPYGPPPAYRAYYRPAPPRCFTRMERFWNGWRWAERPVRLCR
ncbi:hypothetical protein [Microvirga pudoricolor]|uniref:hypothetical protein n=1 Tax=Microvirga pudoricolor TaxID=2778729 RepID=UPI001951A9A4|nr:hypothetical protein [Microvirga pudoricolor]MBM6595928.1 hypothetical protein [Microvirga pudoricolor]